MVSACMFYKDKSVTKLNSVGVLNQTLAVSLFVLLQQTLVRGN